MLKQYSVNNFKIIKSVKVILIPYILECNSHPVFGDFLNEKKLVHGSNLHLSFNRALPTGRLIE
jgi:hypothetical protein